MSPGRLCSVPRCGKIVPEGEAYVDGCLRCDQRREARKPWANKRERLPFYSTAKWQKIVKVKKAMNPICEICNDALTEEIDHIEPATASRPDLWFDWDNLQSACKPCHNKKTAAASAQARKNG